MKDRSQAGIVFYLFSRIFVAVAACVLLIPMIFLPMYKDRLTSIIASQGETFTSTLLAVKSEALYEEDYASVIEYTRNVLNGTSDIQQVYISRRAGPAVEVNADTWSFLDATETNVFNSRPLSPGETNIQLVEERSALSAEIHSSFLYSVPVVLSKYHWGEIKIRISSAHYQELIADYYFNYLLLAVGLITGVLLLMYVSSRRIVRQLETVRTSAIQLAEGDLQVRVPADGVGEIAALSQSFNAMATSLEEQTRRNTQLANVVEETNEGFAIFDRNNATIFVNRAMESLLSDMPGEIPGTLEGVLDLFAQEDLHSPIMVGGHGAAIHSDAIVKDSDPMQFVELKLQNIEAENDDGAFCVLAVSDLTQRKVLEQQLNEIAHYDKLTGLPNRRLFMSSLDTALEHESNFVVLFMDLDNFKFINDSLGHEAGDHVLEVVTKRFRRCLRSDDMLARLGGDEFTAILTSAPSKEDTENLCQRIVDHASTPIEYAGHELLISVSIGAVNVPDDADTLSDVLRKADVAMYHTKQTGKRGFSFFHQEMMGAVRAEATVRRI